MNVMKAMMSARYQFRRKVIFILIGFFLLRVALMKLPNVEKAEEAGDLKKVKKPLQKQPVKLMDVVPTIPPPKTNGGEHKEEDWKKDAKKESHIGLVESDIQEGDLAGLDIRKDELLGLNEKREPLLQEESQIMEKIVAESGKNKTKEGPEAEDDTKDKESKNDHLNHDEEEKKKKAEEKLKKSDDTKNVVVSSETDMKKPKSEDKGVDAAKIESGSKKVAVAKEAAGGGGGGGGGGKVASVKKEDGPKSSGGKEVVADLKKGPKAISPETVGVKSSSKDNKEMIGQGQNGIKGKDEAWNIKVSNAYL